MLDLLSDLIEAASVDENSPESEALFGKMIDVCVKERLSRNSITMIVQMLAVAAGILRKGDIDTAAALAAIAYTLIGEESDGS